MKESLHRIVKRNNKYKNLSLATFIFGTLLFCLVFSFWLLQGKPFNWMIIWSLIATIGMTFTLGIYFASQIDNYLKNKIRLKLEEIETEEEKKLHLKGQAIDEQLELRELEIRYEEDEEDFL